MLVPLVHSDCCFLAPCTNILTNLLTYNMVKTNQPPQDLFISSM